MSDVQWRTGKLLAARLYSRDGVFTTWEVLNSSMKSNDLLLILDKDPKSLGVLRTVAERLGCDHVEADSADGLKDILSGRRPTIAVLAVDGFDVDGLAMLQVLALEAAQPATLLIGTVHARVLAGARRTAESQGLRVIGVASRPLDAVAIEQLLMPYLTSAPPIALGELEQAFAEHELILEYLPKLDIRAAVPKMQGVEALVRWQHPRRGLLYPRHFLGPIENHELMTRLTDFVLTESVRQASQWRALGLPLEMVVNLSPKLVRDREFPERVAVLLRENEVPAQQLVLDVTEASSLESRDLMLDVFTRLRILGVGLSLDNFGTGVSSLTDLYRMPFSELKVDHALIADAAREREAMLIVQAIANLAHTLELEVCAVGVETREMLGFVRSNGFDTAQGRFFSGPVKPAEIERLVGTWPCSEAAATGRWRVMKSVT
jgi:EAL domain-containing protein (putative c-di-GMP-specific phosphodiesterase class I)